jgi:hypothetical protein
MHRLLTRLHRDERGMTYVFVGMGFMAFMAATTLAIDVGMFMTARSQAQNSADAGALGGAWRSLSRTTATDRRPGPRCRPPSGRRANQVVGGPGERHARGRQFLLSPRGPRQPRPRHRAPRPRRGNAVPTLMGRFFGVQTADITATATAEASPANAMTCVKPFTIPDRWIENGRRPPWDVSDTFDMYDNKGNLLANPDIYVPPTEPGYTGYNAERDKGMRLMIRAGTGNNIEPSFYFSYAIGGITGGSAYDWNIANCNTTVMGFGDLLLMEPGNMVGPTTSGVADLIARDPNAYWDTSRNKVVSTMNPSPRVAIIPVFDPCTTPPVRRTAATPT